MSEINKKLNALSLQKNDSLSMSAPLRAATVKPVAKSRAPLWAAAGFCVAALAGGVGWWLGSQGEVPSPADAAKPENSQQSQAISAQQAEMSKPEPAAIQPELTTASSAPVAPQVTKENSQRSKAALGSETVKHVSKSAPAAKAEIKKTKVSNTEVTNTEESNTGVNNTQPVSKRKEPSPVVHKPKPAGEKHTPANRVDTKQAEPFDDEQAEGLSIETVELDAGQLARVEYHKAKKALKSGDSRKAIGYLEAALKYQPEWANARQKLSALYYGRGETRKAIAALQQGLALDSEQPDLRLTMAKLLVNESQQQAALNVLSQLPAQSHSEYLAMRGALAQQLKNNELAMSSYRVLVKEQPYDGRWWMGLGIALERSERAEKAMDAYRQALLMGRISPQSQQFIQQRLALLEAREG